MSEFAGQLRNNPLRTRDDARRLLLDLNAPLRAGFSSGRAQVRLGLESAHFDRKAEWFEGFARPLWGLAPLTAGGGRFEGWEDFREGFRNGTDPAHPEYWEQPGDHDQRSVEMAAAGFALALVPEELWEPLPPEARRKVAAWLGSIQHVGMADNNWHFFPVLAGLGLQRVGEAIDAASRDRHLARLDEFYRRDGWYGDGIENYIDHYNGFAIQFYGLLYAALAGDRDPGRAALYRDRSTQFAQGFAQWFAADGATLAIGRSLTYRFATAAFWGALAYANVEALPWGVIRGLWARQIRWWMEQPVTDEAGRLRVGYRYPNMLMSENYNSQGSPYWAFKAFLPLALPEDHPFWQAEEAPHPAGDGVTTIPGASMIVSRQNGDVFALPAGTVRTQMRGAVDKYAKFSYSTHHGPCVEAERWISYNCCGDNILTVSPDGVDWHMRRTITASHVGEDWIETRWNALPEVPVRSLQFFLDGWEVRLHALSSPMALQVVESGHAVPCRAGSRGRLAQLLNGDEAAGSGVLLRAGDDYASAILDPCGHRKAGTLDVMANTSLMFPQASVPVLAARLDAGTTVLASAVRAWRGAGEANGPAPSGEAVLERARRCGDWGGRLDGLRWPGHAERLREERRPSDQAF